MDLVYEDYEPTDIEEVICFFVEQWRKGYIQAADTDAWWPLFQMGQNIARNHEFFVYYDEDSAKSWQQHGRTDRNDSEMAHVIWDKRGLTVACGSSEILAKLKEHIDKKRGDRVAHKFIALKIQREHARHIRSQVKQSILGWLNGTLHNHPTEQMAKTFDVELHAPRFLKKLLKAVDQIDLENED